MSLSFLRPQPALKEGENDNKNDISHFCQFSQNLQQLKPSLNKGCGKYVDR